MSAVNTHTPVVPEQRPSFGDLIQRVLPGVFFIPLAGPPVILLLGPWLLLVLLIIPPAALLITLVLVLVVCAGALVALGAVIASPYLLVRHLHARHAAHSRPVTEARDVRPVGQSVGAHA